MTTYIIETQETANVARFEALNARHALAKYILSRGGERGVAEMYRTTDAGDDWFYAVGEVGPNSAEPHKYTYFIA